MNKDLWSPKRRFEVQYQKALTDLGGYLQKSIEGSTDPFDIVAMLKAMLKNMTFLRYSDELAAKIVINLFRDGAKTWRYAAKENTHGRVIYDALRRELQGPVGGSVAFQIQRNAEIIKSLPLGIAKQITDYIAEESLKGRRASSIAQNIQEKLPGISRNKANLIARTEVSKTSTALTRARCENIGLDWYRWRTSGDGRVRDSHRIMNKVLVSWRDPPLPERLAGLKNPPAPYHAGDIYNCRCYPAPVISLDHVKFPCKVYRNNAITTMTRHEFESIMG